MWIDATGGEDELGPAGAVGVGGEECYRHRCGRHWVRGRGC